MEASDEVRPQKGEWWEVAAGQGQGRRLQIVEVPDIIPAQTPYAVVQITGEPGTRNIAIDERWGRTLVKVESDASADERRRLKQQTSYDRLLRVGIGHYGIEDPADIVTLILIDYATWGEGAPLEHLVENARERARKALTDA